MRLIDADALVDEAYQPGAYGYVDAFQIENAPTIDAVPVIRCDNCKHFREFDEDYKRRWRSNWDGMCMYWNAHSTMKDGFCSVAEEKTDKEEECYDFD